MAGSKLVLEGRVSVKAFVLGLSVIVIPLIRTWFGHLDWVFDYLTETPGKIVICIHIAVINGLLLIIYRGPLYKWMYIVPLVLFLMMSGAQDQSGGGAGGGAANGGGR